jgi:uncharacterized protein (TIGR00730 family)
LSAALENIEAMLYGSIGIYGKVLRTLGLGTTAVAVMGSARDEKKVADFRKWEPVAEHLGQLLAKRGYSLTTGGCGGIPGAVIRGFTRFPGRKKRQLCVGVRIGSLNFEQAAAEGIDILLTAKNFFARLAMLVFLAPGGVIMMPGGIGSRLEGWMWLQIVQVTKWRVPVVFVNLDGHYHDIERGLQELLASGLYDKDQLNGLVQFVSTPEEAMEIIDRFNTRSQV